jgi:hypothetical protein
VPTIADIFINSHFDSALEARFIEVLRHLNGCEGLPTVKLVQDIVNGKAGYLLEVASLRYWIEPQVELADPEGVRVACKPDFVIWPGKASASRRPIAVFCDGWTYHRDTRARGRAEAQRPGRQRALLGVVGDQRRRQGGPRQRAQYGPGITAHVDEL